MVLCKLKLIRFDRSYNVSVTKAVLSNIMLYGEGNEVVQKFYNGCSGSFKQPWNSTINENFTAGRDCRHHLIQSVPRKVWGPKNQREVSKVTEPATGRVKTGNCVIFFSISHSLQHTTLTQREYYVQHVVCSWIVNWWFSTWKVLS